MAIVVGRTATGFDSCFYLAQLAFSMTSMLEMLNRNHVGANTLSMVTSAMSTISIDRKSLKQQRKSSSPVCTAVSQLGNMDATLKPPEPHLASACGTRPGCYTGTLRKAEPNVVAAPEPAWMRHWNLPEPCKS